MFAASHDLYCNNSMRAEIPLVEAGLTLRSGVPTLTCIIEHGELDWKHAFYGILRVDFMSSMLLSVVTQECQE